MLHLTAAAGFYSFRSNAETSRRLPRAQIHSSWWVLGGDIKWPFKMYHDKQALLAQGLSDFGVLLVAMSHRFDVADLETEWDQIESVRARLRDGKPLVIVPVRPVGVNKSSESSIVECVTNSDVLIPCLHRLLPAQLKLPDIGPLREVIQLTYKKVAREPTMDLIDEDSWQLRKHLRFVKRKAQREDPSTESRWLLQT